MGIAIALLIVIGLIAGLLLNESKPTVNPSKEADQLAEKMLTAINKSAWDTTRIVQWTFFAGKHHYLWDKERNFVKVNWSNNVVLLNTKEVNGKAYVDGQLQEGSKAEKLIKTAWGYFCNDSFWLNAPAKAFDPGTKRSIVKVKGGQKGLMVSYESGGVTPGDSYVWILDENGLPKAWKMWVKIIPIGGVKTSWEDWIELEGGAKVAKAHSTAGPTLKLSNLKAGNDWGTFGEEKDPFQVLLN